MTPLGDPDNSPALASREAREAREARDKQWAAARNEFVRTGDPGAFTAMLQSVNRKLTPGEQVQADIDALLEVVSREEYERNRCKCGRCTPGEEWRCGDPWALGEAPTWPIIKASLARMMARVQNKRH